MKVRGSESSDVPVCARQGLTLDFPHHGFLTFGFRLVHDASSRVFRGGGWSNSPGYARVANRNRIPPSGRNSIVGFRLVREEA